MALFSLEDQLTFYGPPYLQQACARGATEREFESSISHSLIPCLLGAFHHNKWNQLIHIVFVPAIVWSAMVFFIFLTPGVDHSFATLNEGDALSKVLPTNGINLSLPMLLLYCGYYLTLDFVPAIFYDVFLYFLYLVAHHVVATYENALWIALGVHILGWYMQIHPGHLVLEKRRPALTQSFFQSLVLAPIFTWFELLFAMGFRKKLYDRVTRRVVANIRQYRDGVPPEKQKF